MKETNGKKEEIDDKGVITNLVDITQLLGKGAPQQPEEIAVDNKRIKMRCRWLILMSICYMAYGFSVLLANCPAKCSEIFLFSCHFFVTQNK